MKDTSDFRDINHLISILFFAFFTENGRYCGAFVNYKTIDPVDVFNPNQVRAVNCHAAGIKYVCADVH